MPNFANLTEQTIAVVFADLPAEGDFYLCDSEDKIAEAKRRIRSGWGAEPVVFYRAGDRRPGEQPKNTVNGNVTGPLVQCAGAIHGGVRF